MGMRLFLSGCALLLAAGHAHAERLYSVRVRTNPRGAVVYVDSRDAGVRGTTPHRLRLPRGKHKIILEAPGHEPFETVIDVRRSDIFTFTLSRERPKARLRVVTTDPDAAVGSTVLVNGKSEGALPGNFTLKAGSHLIAVHKAGYKLWQQWVDVGEGDQRTLTVDLVPKGPKTGTVLVSSPTPGAKVFLDGKLVGDSPALLHKIPAGPHLLEIRAEGHPPKSKTVEVVADQTNKFVVAHDLPAPTQKKVGTLQVLAEPVGVDVYVDGDFRGKAPTTVADLAEGTHIAVGKLPGYLPAELRIEITAGRVQTVKLALERVGVPSVAAASQAASGTLSIAGTNGAQVRLNGSVVGVVPLEKTDVPAGTHTVSIEMSGHKPWKSPVDVGAGQRVALSIVLQPESLGPGSQPVEPAVDPQDDPDIVRGLSSYGAQLIPPRYFTADISFGFPYIAEGRLTTGIHDWEWIALDAGVELRTYGAFTEFDVMTKLRLLFREPLALAALVAVGGGGGPKGRNTFFLNAGVTASLMFKKILTFTGRIYANVYTDRHCPTSAGGSEMDICSETNATTLEDRVGDSQNPRDRYAGARLMLTALLEIPITKNIGAFLLVEGAPFQSQRMAFKDDFASIMSKNDPRVYGRAGATFKF